MSLQAKWRNSVNSVRVLTLKDINESQAIFEILLTTLVRVGTSSLFQHGHPTIE